MYPHSNHGVVISTLFLHVACMFFFFFLLVLLGEEAEADVVSTDKNSTGPTRIRKPSEIHSASMKRN